MNKENNRNIFTPLFRLLRVYIKDVKKDIRVRKDGSTQGVHLTNALRQPYKGKANECLRSSK